MKGLNKAEAVSDAMRRADSQFHQGTNYQAYQYLGAHLCDNGHILFRTFAPNADRVSVCGDFNQWNTEEYPLHRVGERGVWEICLPPETAKEGSLYKFFIRNGKKSFYKADPYGFACQRPPDTASVLCELSGFSWKDRGWMEYRSSRFTREQAPRQPINIYEIHAGSWKRHGDGSLYSYRDLAADLLPYVKQMGYTHVELMPIAEHPGEDSWGYLCTGFYAPTARYGAPADLMAFVDAMHEGGIGVILDWTPCHFPRDEHGLAAFDGGTLYEYADPGRTGTPWGSLYFDIDSPWVQSFLISNAVFWAKEYHIDGLRVDAVAEMLYPAGGIPDSRAVAFFQKLNSRMCAECPDVMMIAEDSSAHPGVTGFDRGGLGFTFKWNMGWMNDTLSYLAEDPLWRHCHHHKMTFAMSYHRFEQFLLPLSHDEVVHGKRSLIERAPGEYRQKFANLRAYYLWQMTHPGKKLMFMGGEFGQFCEWDYRTPLEWFLLDYPMHAGLQRFVSDLNRFFLAHPALWEGDADPDGFFWLDADNEAESVYSFCRRDRGGEELVMVFNFLPVERESFLLKVPRMGHYQALFDTDAPEYGGNGEDRASHEAVALPEGGCGIQIALSPMSARIYRTAGPIGPSVYC